MSTTRTPSLNPCERCAYRLGPINEPGDERCAAEARQTEVKTYPTLVWMRAKAGPCGPGARLYQPAMTGIGHVLQ